MRALPLVLLLVVFKSVAGATGFGDSGTMQVMDGSMELFWTRAKWSNAEPANIPEGVDPKVPPISMDKAKRVAKSSYLAGN